MKVCCVTYKVGVGRVNILLLLLSLLFYTKKLVFRRHIYNIILSVDYLHHCNINKHLKYS